MNEIIYTANGMDKIYTFSFPYFADGDIRVALDDAELDINQFSIEKISTSKTNNSNIPFSGGNVHFQIAPTKNSVIRIWREIDLTRHIDYQPTTKFDPITLNQDLNFNLEVLKDFYNKLTDFQIQYINILSLPENAELLSSIQTVIEKIDGFVMPDTDATQEQINDLSNQINAKITTINNELELLKNKECESGLDLSNLTADDKNTIISLGVPDYDARLEVDHNLTTGQYIVPNNGYYYCSCFKQVSNQSREIRVNGVPAVGATYTNTYDANTALINCRAGDIITVSSTSGVAAFVLYFLPYKGAI